MNYQVDDDVFGLGGGPLRTDILPAPNEFQSEIAHIPFIVTLRSGEIVVVPVGFKTDFASVPRIFWRIVPPWGRYSPAAVIHDYFYYKHTKTRKEADEIFLELMERLNVPRWKRKSMYWAVRACGWKAWSNYEKPSK